MIEGVIFDFGFTLFYFPDASTKKYFECFKEGLSKSIKFLEEENLIGDNINIKKLVYSFNKKRLSSYQDKSKSILELDTPTLFKEILSDFKIQITDEKMYQKLAALYHSCEENEWTPFEETEDTLKALKKMNLKIGLISNHPFHKSIVRMLENYELKNYFDFIMTSGKFGKRKPFGEIFINTINNMGLKKRDKSNIIMCGDEYADVVGAHKTGLIPVLFQRRVKFPFEKEINVPDLLTIRNIVEIIEIIRNFNN
jgi:HAD superfamily hydrolase (TIGR01549 family)